MKRMVLSCLGTWLLAVSAHAAIDVGSDSSDGVFNPTNNVVIDLSQAVKAPWNTPSPEPGKGVYDADKWAVVFKFASVDIPAGVTVSFKNHATRAPVVWLVSGNVKIDGGVYLHGDRGHNAEGPAEPAEPGPGGFRGGRGYRTAGFVVGSGGYGPGGAFLPAFGCTTGTGASHGTDGWREYGTTTPPPTYGDAGLLTLIGGSGGAAKERGACFANDSGAGAGGGAILIACGDTISGNGWIGANGGWGGYGGSGGGGSGGAIRLVADRAQNRLSLEAVGAANAGDSFAGRGGQGRIRVEGNIVDLSGATSPAASVVLLTGPPVIWPPASAPSVRVVTIGPATVPADPTAELSGSGADVILTDDAPQLLVIEARNVPGDWKVVARVVPKSGRDSAVDATFVSGDLSLSTWHATVTLPKSGPAAIQVRASKP